MVTGWSFGLSHSFGQIMEHYTINNEHIVYKSGWRSSADEISGGDSLNLAYIS